MREWVPDETWADDLDSFLLVKKPKLKNPPSNPFPVFNVIVDTGFVKKSDITLFTDRDLDWWDLEAVVVPANTTAAELMVILGLFPSKGQARKNGWPGAIPDGWSQLKVGKGLVFCWKPTE